MLAGPRWEEARPLAELRSVDLTIPDLPFTDGEWLYATTGLQIGQGGMGAVYALERRPARSGSTGARPAEEVEQVVGKVFRSEYLCQLRTDAVSRGDHERTLELIARIASLRHP